MSSQNHRLQKRAVQFWSFLLTLVAQRKKKLKTQFKDKYKFIIFSILDYGTNVWFKFFWTIIYRIFENFKIYRLQNFKIFFWTTFHFQLFFFFSTILDPDPDLDMNCDHLIMCFRFLKDDCSTNIERDLRVGMGALTTKLLASFCSVLWKSSNLGRLHNFVIALGIPFTPLEYCYSQINGK